MFASQEAVDAAFADMDSLLAEHAPAPVSGCVNCGGVIFERGQNEGQCFSYFDVCRACGAVNNDTFGFGDMQAYPPRRSSSNYKRIHHWHERVSQLLLQESRIPDEHFQQIAERLLDGTHTYVNKDIIRAVLRSLNMQMYIEKWLQIIWRLTGIEPPKPGAQLMQCLDDAFIELQRPFDQMKATGRKNFLNYNYVLCRLFQKLKCPRFGMFFPLIKSRQKLKALDETWCKMTASIGWDVTPLVQVTPFSVSLLEPELLRERLASPDAFVTPSATCSTRTRTGFRKSDLCLLRALDRQTWIKQRRLARPGPELQRLGSAVKRPRSGKVKLLRSSLPAAHRR